MSSTIVALISVLSCSFISLYLQKLNKSLHKSLLCKLYIVKGIWAWVGVKIFPSLSQVMGLW